MMTEQVLDIDELAALAQASASATDGCPCEIASYAGWTRIPVSFPRERMRPAGTLAGDPYADPTYAEYHPHGTNYWSPTRRSPSIIFRTTAARSSSAWCACATA